MITDILVIGSGISGLTSAYLLDKHHNITLFEKNDYFGGHTHTHSLSDGEREFNVDSGFIVYNENTYPNFIKLLDKLSVKRQHTEMGFSVKSNMNDFEYSGNSLNAFFAQRINILKPSFLKMICDILRFNKLSSSKLYSLNNNLSLKDFLYTHNFSTSFIENYVIPMGAAIWSTSPKLMLDMPASFFIRFFKNHGLLQITNRPQWWVIKNGSKQYVKEIIKPFEKNIRLNTEISMIERYDRGVKINYKDGQEEFDAVVIGGIRLKID